MLCPAKYTVTLGRRSTFAASSRISAEPGLFDPMRTRFWPNHHLRLVPAEIVQAPCALNAISTPHPLHRLIGEDCPGSAEHSRRDQ